MEKFEEKMFSTLAYCFPLMKEKETLFVIKYKTYEVIKFPLSFLYYFELRRQRKLLLTRFMGWVCMSDGVILVLLHKRYWRNAPLTLFWRQKCHSVYLIGMALCKSVQAGRRYFVSFSLFVHAHSWGQPDYSRSTPAQQYYSFPST